MPFPNTGPTDRDAVKAQLKIDADDIVDDEAIDDVVAAVNQFVRDDVPIAQALDTDPAPAGWGGAPRVVLGATMLGARLFRRRNSPDGVAAFGEGAMAYVQRNDPDVALLLRIGAYAKPTVG